MDVDSKWFGFWRNAKDGETHLPALDQWTDPAWNPEDKQELLAYIAGVPSVLAVGMPYACAICGKNLGSIAYQSDGAWLWPVSLNHYILDHHIRIPNSLVQHIRKADYRWPNEIAVALTELPWPKRLGDSSNAPADRSFGEGAE